MEAATQASQINRPHGTHTTGATPGAVSPAERIALSVFISMPSLSSSTKHMDEDIEAIIPDICFGVAQVNVVE
jgi:hypothetical protein